MTSLHSRVVDGSAKVFACAHSETSREFELIVILLRSVTAIGGFR